MSAAPEHLTIDQTLALSPEQRVLLPGEGPALLARASMRVNVIPIRLDGALDEARLRRALESVCRRHDLLQGAFRPVPGYRGLRWHRLAQPPAPVWAHVDLTGHIEPGGPTPLAHWARSIASTPLAIEHGQVVRAAFARTAPDQALLVIAASALVADAGSLRALCHQTVEAYRGDTDGQPRAGFQYAQYVEWRHEMAVGEEAHAGQAYWASALGEAPSWAALKLPYRHRTRQPGSPPVRAVASLGAGLHAQVAAAAEAHGVRVDLFLQALWWLQLARLNGFAGFLGGWQHDCRRDYDVMRGAVGLFEKVLPVLVDARADERFADWLARMACAAAHHVEAQEQWPVDAPPVTSHLVAGFAFNEHELDGTASLGWHPVDLPGPMPCFELALHVDWGSTGAEIAVHVDGAHYTLEAATCLQQQFVSALQSVLAQPSAQAADLNLVSSDERELLLARNAHRADFGHRTLAAHVEAWAERTPDAPAVEAGDCRLSYRQLDHRARRVAHWLQGHGLRAGDLVALRLPRSLDLPVAILAAWRLGAAYLPIDPDWPAARVDAVLADARPTLLVHVEPTAGTVVPPCRAAVFDSVGFDAPDDATEALAPAGATPDDLAYVLYTSGSTGQPKGVPIAHAHLFNYAAAASEAMALGEARRWAMTSSVAADLGHTAMLGALCNGACLVVAAPEDTKDAEAFARFMRQREIDGLKIVPSHLEALLECEAPQLPDKLVLGGEAAPRSLLTRIAQLHPACSVHNHYGPTEATVGVMVHAVDLNGGAANPLPEVLPLSRVLANNRVYVLDEALRLVPRGATGQLCIGGAQLCRGYLNRETSPAFVADPFEPGAALYRTGDLAQVLLDGSVQMVGRADHQLKVRGYRVEPAEIEAVLLAQPGVRQAVVVPVRALEGGTGAVALKAFLVATPAVACDDGLAALRESVALVLPDHMRPACHVFLPVFPRLANGKVDRLALAALPDDDAHTGTRRPPRDALEFVLVDCMATLLGQEALGAEDDFFEAGGHSLLVIKLVARVRKRLGEEMAPAMVFDHPTAAALARALRAASADAARLDRQASAQQQTRA